MRKLNKNLWLYQMSIKPNGRLIDDWCESNIGKRFYDWYGYNSSFSDERVYAFKNAADQLIFKLKWSYNDKIT